MSSELVAALVGAVAGGIIALLGGIAQVFIQGWMSERGKITCDITAWELTVEIEGMRTGSWKEARTFIDEPSTEEPQRPHFAHMESREPRRAHYEFVANFLNTKGTNAAVLEYSVEFLKGKQTVLANVPTPGGMSAGQAVTLPAETVTGIPMYSEYFNIAPSAKVLREVDRVEFIARLSSGPPIRVELERLSQDSNGAQKADAT